MTFHALYAVVLSAALYSVTEPTAGAQSAHRSMSRGEEVARSVCSACHQVAADQEFPPLLVQPTPSFTEIANRPGTSVRSLERFITMTHWNEETIPMRMPNPMLTSEDTAAVAHYILSLRSPGKGVP
jgi:mono/diheme cytochrome c family protein